MKILYTNFHQYHKGGHATYILNLFEALHQDNVVHVADPETSGLNLAMREMASDCVFPQNFPKRITQIAQIFKEALRLRKLIKKYQYDIVHANGSPDLQMVILACFLLCKRPAIVYTKHNTLPISRNIFSKFKFKCAKQIITVCGYQRPAFLEIGIAKTCVTVIKNGLDTSLFPPATQVQRKTMRDQLSLQENDLVLLSSAGTAPYKRWEHMIEAVSQIQNPHLKIVFVGGAPSLENQKRFIKDLNMSDRVIFVGEVKDTRPYVAAGDVGFLLSDQVEAVPFACREMMSMGLPMILSDYACLPENVTPGENGWIVKTGDIASIKAAVEDAYTKRDQLPQMGEKAHEQAVRDFGIKKFVQETYQIYQKAIKTLN